MSKQTTPTIGLSLRVPAYIRDALEEMARQRRMATGENCTVADVAREALVAELKAHGFKPSNPDDEETPKP